MYKYLYTIIFVFSSLLIYQDAYSTNLQYLYQDAQDDSCSLQISLLTNTPSDRAVYTMYGHTAIRVKDPNQKLDIVFNYGVFNFNAPNFLYRFIKGETYYWVESEAFSQYVYRYAFQGVGIIEQVLNLECKDKINIWNALSNNSLEENKTYLYNFFFDNCSTRPRDIIENNVSSEIAYKYPDNIKKTYRDLVHECVSKYPWIEFGIDLMLGSPADQLTTRKDRMFLPIYLKESYDIAEISDSVSLKPLVLRENTILSSMPFDEQDTTPYPLIVGLVLLVITLLLSFYARNTIFLKFFDFIIFFIAGLAGSIIFFLMFFSIHPCMIPNWNIVWLNPLMLFVALFSFFKMFSKCIYYYHFINFVVLVLFCLAWFLIPQTLNTAFAPYVLTLCVRSGAKVYDDTRNLSIRRKRKK